MKCSFCLKEMERGYIKSPITEDTICIQCVKDIDKGRYSLPATEEDNIA